MDIQEIIQHAKDSLLERGSHVPLLLIETQHRFDLMVLVSDAENTLEREKVLFAAGRGYGKEHPEMEIEQLVLITEMWFSSQPPDKPIKPGWRPSRDPERKEGLIVAILDIVARKVTQSGYLVEMLRDGAGNLIDLLPLSAEPQPIQSMLLPSYLPGWLQQCQDVRLGICPVHQEIYRKVNLC